MICLLFKTLIIKFENGRRERSYESEHFYLQTCVKNQLIGASG